MAGGSPSAPSVQIILVYIDETRMKVLLTLAMVLLSGMVWAEDVMRIDKGGAVAIVFPNEPSLE